MDEIPTPATGPDLAGLRRTLGVRQDHLARRLGVHRVTLNGWERSAEVDAIKAGRYRIAVRELADEAIRAEATA